MEREAGALDGGAVAAELGLAHFIRFSPGNAETSSILAMSRRSVVARMLALSVLVGLFAPGTSLAFQAISMRKLSGRGQNP